MGFDVEGYRKAAKELNLSDEEIQRDIDEETNGVAAKGANANMANVKVGQDFMGIPEWLQPAAATAAGSLILGGAAGLGLKLKDRKATFEQPTARVEPTFGIPDVEATPHPQNKFTPPQGDVTYVASRPVGEPRLQIGGPRALPAPEVAAPAPAPTTPPAANNIVSQGPAAPPAEVAPAAVAPLTDKQRREKAMADLAEHRLEEAKKASAAKEAQQAEAKKQTTTSSGGVNPQDRQMLNSSENAKIDKAVIADQKAAAPKPAPVVPPAAPAVPAAPVAAAPPAAPAPVTAAPVAAAPVTPVAATEFKLPTAKVGEDAMPIQNGAKQPIPMSAFTNPEVAERVKKVLGGSDLEYTLRLAQSRGGLSTEEARAILQPAAAPAIEGAVAPKTAPAPKWPGGAEGSAVQLFGGTKKNFTPESQAAVEMFKDFVGGPLSMPPTGGSINQIPEASKFYEKHTGEPLPRNAEGKLTRIPESQMQKLHTGIRTELEEAVKGNKLGKLGKGAMAAAALLGLTTAVQAAQKGDFGPLGEAGFSGLLAKVIGGVAATAVTPSEAAAPTLENTKQQQQNIDVAQRPGVKAYAEILKNRLSGEEYNKAISEFAATNPKRGDYAAMQELFRQQASKKAKR